MATIKHIQHLKSKELSGSSVKKPTASLFADGEIIVNYNSKNPTLFLRDDLGAVREFPVRESVLGKTDVAADSSKLGGIGASNYYHSGNSNRSNIDWVANNATFHGNVTLGPKITATYNSGKTFCDFKMTDVDFYLGHSGRSDNPTIFLERKNTTNGVKCFSEIALWDDRGMPTLSFFNTGHINFSNKSEPLGDFVVRSTYNYFFSDYTLINPSGGKTIIGKFRESLSEVKPETLNTTAQLTVLGDIECANIKINSSCDVTKDLSVHGIVDFWNYGSFYTGLHFEGGSTFTDGLDGDYITLSGTMVCGGVNVSGNINQTSSINFKTNIEKFEEKALDLVNKVNIVKYNYKNDLSTQHIGFIAEDTPKELSSEKQNVMDIGSCIGVLLKSIQELQEEIKKLKK